MTDRNSLFTFKFWSSLCYFLRVKWRLLTAFHPQTDGQTKRQNSMIEAFLRVFVSFKQNDWARLLPMVEFAYNNAKNASTGHTPFELNCGYQPRMSYKEDVDPRSSLSWQTSYQWNSESWWLFVGKISTMPRNFKNELIIRESNHGATPLVKNFGWIANISRPNAIGSWNQSFLGCSRCSILLESKYTS